MVMQKSVVGSELRIRIAGTYYPVTPAMQSFDQTLVAGGIGDSGTQTVGVLKSDLPTKPAQFAITIYNGQTLAVMNVTGNETMWLIEIGDPSAND